MTRGQATDGGATRRQVLKGLAAAPLAMASAQAETSAHYDVAIIGAGVFGAWTAWHLSKAGLRIALVDAYGPGNSRSSSGGESRVIRIAYGADAFYSRWSQAALPVWQALSDRLELPIFHRTGVLWFSPVRDAYIDDSLRTLEQLDVDVEILDRTGLARRYPQINSVGIEIGFVEIDSGGLMARRAVQAVVGEAFEAGTTFIRDQAGPPLAEGEGVRIRLSHGDPVVAGTAIYACGPWLGKLFPDHIGARIRPTRQEVFYFGPRAGDRRFTPPAMPVWADFNDGDIYYGLPDLEGRGFKIAHDAHGPEIDPDEADRRPRPEALRQVRAYIARRFPDLADAPLTEARVCQYENTSSGDFLIDSHPEHPQVWLVGGGSGHGFKHGPSLGAYLAERIMGHEQTVEDRFRLDNKKMGDDRSVH